MDTSEAPEKLHLRLDELKGIQKSLLRSMDQKIDSHLSAELVDSRSRQEITELLQGIVYETMEIVQHAVEIDDVLPDNRSKYSLQELINNKQLSNQKIEPFDYALNEKIRQLYSEVDEESTRVNDLRRSIPSEVLHTRQVYAKRLGEEIDSLVKEASSQKKSKAANVEGEEDPDDDDDDDLDSEGEETGEVDWALQAQVLRTCAVMREEYEQVLADIYEMKTDLPSLKKDLDTLETVSRHFQT